MRSSFIKLLMFVLMTNTALAQGIGPKPEVADNLADEEIEVVPVKKPVEAVSTLKPSPVKIVAPELPKAQPIAKPITISKPKVEEDEKILLPDDFIIPLLSDDIPEDIAVRKRLKSTDKQFPKPKVDLDEEVVVVEVNPEDAKKEVKEEIKNDEEETVVEVSPEEAKKEVKEEIKKAVEAATESTRNYKPETCVWAEDIPRKIVLGKSCSAEGSRICVGYVICEQKVGGGKFTRMSTCSEGLCGEGDASACTREGGYGSFKPKPKNAEFVSKKIQDVLKSSAKGE